MIRNDISSEIDLIVQNLPSDLSDLEKARWLYIKLGFVFSYDMDILKDDDVYTKSANYELGALNAIDRFQTCHQISNLLVQIFSLPNVNINSKVITRDIPQRNYSVDHEAVAIFLDNDKKYLLDLTLDLYLIQSGCQTREFGYSTDDESTYDILSLKETAELDKKLNLIPKNDYLDTEIKNFKDNTYLLEIKEENNFDMLMDMIINRFNFLFVGVQEGKQFINKIWTDILPPTIVNSMKEYNIHHYDENDNVQVVSVYLFNTNLFNKCYLYDNNNGLFVSSSQKVIEMLDNGWKTNSMSLEDNLFDILDSKKDRKR